MVNIVKIISSELRREENVFLEQMQFDNHSIFTFLKIYSCAIFRMYYTGVIS